MLETTPKVFVRALARGTLPRPRPTWTPVAGWRCSGRRSARTLFGDRDPVGQQVTIAGVRFRVVGVFAPLGQSLGVDRDDEVHIPVTAAHRLFGTTRVDGIAVKAPDRETIDELGDRIVAELNRSATRTPSSARSPRSRSSAYSATSSAC